MIVEMSLGQLISNTERIDTTKRHHIANEVQIVGGYEATRMGQSDILFEAVTNTGHHPKIRGPLKEAENGVAITTVDNQSIMVQPISRSADDVQVSCDCEDFFHRFATMNSKNGVLFGKITRPYIPKGTRQVEPVSTVPAVCKHLIKFSTLLSGEGIFR